MTYLNDTPDFFSIKKVLLIKLRHLGDVVLSTATLSALKEFYPHLEIDMLVNDEAQFLLEGLKDVKKILCYHRKKSKGGLLQKIKAELGLFLEVRRAGYDLVINLTEGDKGNLLAWASKATYKVGQKDSGWQNKLTHLYKKAPIRRHSVERDLDALRRLGLYPQESQKSLQIYKCPKALSDIEDFLSAQNVTSFIVLHPVSRWMYKSPQKDFFIKLLENIKEPVFITGSSSGLEKEYIDGIIKHHAHVQYFDTRGSLSHLIALISKASGLITVDSLPLHLASGLKTPTVALFGPTSETDWGPWQNPRSQVVSYKKNCRACYMDGCGGGKLSDCLEQIQISDVMKAIQDVFQADG